MADKEIKIDIVANADKLRSEIKAANKEVESLAKTAADMRKNDIAGARGLETLNRRGQKQTGKNSKKTILASEKALQKQIKATTNALKAQQKAHKLTSQEMVNETQKIQGMIKALTKLRQERRRANIGGGAGFKGMFGKGGSGGQGVNMNTIVTSLKAGVLGAVGGLFSTVGTTISTVVGAAIGAVTSRITDSYAVHQKYEQALSPLSGTGGTRRQMGRARRAGIRMGFGHMDTANLAKQATRQTGQIGATTTAQSMSRLANMDPTEAVGFLGTLTRSGQGFGGKAGAGGNRKLKGIIAAGFKSGLDKARMPEFIKSVGSLVTRQAGRAGGDVDPGAITSILMAMGKSGQSGLQGARGGALLDKLDQSIRKPGGGEAGQALMLQSFGFGKPGGTTSYYDALKRQEQGVAGQGNVQALFSETKSQYGGGESQILALRTMTGLTIDQLEKMREVVENGKSAKEQQKELNKIIKETKPINEQALEVSKSNFNMMATRTAEIRDELRGQGKANGKALETIQDLFRKMMETVWPLVTVLLNKLASLLTSIWETLVETLGGGTTQRVAIQRKISRDKIFDATVKYKKGGSKAAYENTVKTETGNMQNLMQELQRKTADHPFLYGAGDLAYNFGDLLGVADKDNSPGRRAAREIGVLGTSIDQANATFKAVNSSSELHSATMANDLLRQMRQTEDVEEKKVLAAKLADVAANSGGTGNFLADQEGNIIGVEHKATNTPAINLYLPVAGSTNQGEPTLDPSAKTTTNQK